MADNEVESGLELVLDNRKLIIAFGLLIAICGCSFVLGFIEGKRQGYQEGNQVVAETAAPKPVPEPATAPSEKPAMEEVKPVSEPADQQLDWYKTINRKDEAPAAASAMPAPDAVSKAPLPASKAASVESPKPGVNSEQVTYSVQVGAFRQKNELELRAQMLREKGFECRTEAPAGPEQFYLLKVGRFQTRAEASAMQLRLKREGFSSFVKTN